MKKPYSLRQDALEIVISIGIGILQWGFSTSFFSLCRPGGGDCCHFAAELVISRPVRVNSVSDT